MSKHPIFREPFLKPHTNFKSLCVIALAIGIGIRHIVLNSNSNEVVIGDLDAGLLEPSEHDSKKIVVSDQTEHCYSIDMTR
jgi:hypothetical protein